MYIHKVGKQWSFKNLVVSSLTPSVPIVRAIIDVMCGPQKCLLSMPPWRAVAQLDHLHRVCYNVTLDLHDRQAHLPPQ
jgi:hypothetical protein